MGNIDYGPFFVFMRALQNGSLRVISTSDHFYKDRDGSV